MIQAGVKAGNRGLREPFAVQASHGFSSLGDCVVEWVRGCEKIPGSLREGIFPHPLHLGGTLSLPSPPLKCFEKKDDTGPMVPV